MVALPGIDALVGIVPVRAFFIHHRSNRTRSDNIKGDAAVT